MKIFMKIALTIVSVLLIIQSVHSEPFASQWEWEKPKRYGKIKSIETEIRDGIKKEFFNKEGKKTSEEVRDKDNKLIFQWVLKYNRDNNLCEVVQKDAEGKIIWKDTATFNKKKKIETITRSSNKEKGYFSYDKEGNPERITVKNKDDKCRVIFNFKFDKSGQPIEASCLDSKGRSRGSSRLFYDDDGFTTGTIMCNSKGVKLIETNNSYKKDKEGNWTEKTTERKIYKQMMRIRPEPVTIKRKIDYY
jgi:hypothetical protein